MCFVQNIFAIHKLGLASHTFFPIHPTLNEGVACENYQKQYTVFAVIRAPPQYKSHLVSNVIFNKRHTSSWNIFVWHLAIRLHYGDFWLSMAGVQKSLLSYFSPTTTPLSPVLFNLELF